MKLVSYKDGDSVLVFLFKCIFLSGYVPAGIILSDKLYDKMLKELEEDNLSINDLYIGGIIYRCTNMPDDRIIEIFQSLN